ncbi:MAG: polymer-forming cytoskeletal protein, partial [Calditrichales bacterium]
MRICTSKSGKDPNPLIRPYFSIKKCYNFRKDKHVSRKDQTGEVSSTELNFLGGGTTVEGTIRTNNSIRVDGKIKGKLICKNTLTVGVNGEIEG